MDDSELTTLQSVLRGRWPNRPDGKVQKYVGKFFDCQRIGTRISARVRGNHGIYTVSIRVDGESASSACSCYIGKHGYCHHCAALAATFLNNSAVFPAVERKTREEVTGLSDLRAYLAHTTLESLLQQLKERGVSQTAFAEGIGTSSQHLGVIKRSELRNRFHKELGAVKLACLWMLDHVDEFPSIKRKTKV